MDLLLGPGETDPVPLLFSEEAGLVMEVAAENVDAVLAELGSAGVEKIVVLGSTGGDKTATLRVAGEVVFEADTADLRDTWEATSFELEKRQRKVSCVESEQQGLKSREGPSYSVSFDVSDLVVKATETGTAPKVAVLRQEGSNGDREMAAAFHAAGLAAWDVTVSDLQTGSVSLADFQGLVFVGGFSYGDVMDSGKASRKAPRRRTCSSHPASR